MRAFLDRQGWLVRKATGPMLGLAMAAFLFLAAPDAATARCCGKYSIGGSCCNIFGCNCDGPCSNFGCTCKNGPRDCGDCPGYDTCTSHMSKCSYCIDPLHCCQNDTMCCSSTKAAESPLAPKESAALPGFEELPDPADQFKAADADKSGGISLAEATQWAKANRPNLTAAELKKGFAELDKNKNSSIEPAEFDRDLGKGGAR